jgi:putative inorganic carbon (HCO3(-)) transporter
LVNYLKRYLVPLLVLAYIAGNAYVMAFMRPNFYFYNMIPVGLFIVYAAIFHLQQLVFFLAVCTPLAVSLKSLGLSEGPDLSIPTEPVMIIIMALYMLNQFSHRIADRNFVHHPISLIIGVQLIWMFFTTCTSTEVLISLKYFISRLWFVFSCYVIIPHLFQDKKNILYFAMCYCSSMLIVVFYTWSRHAGYVFNDKAADWVVDPFFNDHTAYGAALAMFIPLLFSFVFLKSAPRFIRIMSLSLLILFVLAIILSFARAGWLSLVVALAIFITLKLKIRFRSLLITFVTLLATFFIFQSEIIYILSLNKNDAKGSFTENLESISNITTDASNLERINRWSCAYRMWLDKPTLGWGPGTYQFKYAPYQKSWNYTIISTNFGTMGNAHSEYLGPLSEQGLPGLVIVIVLLLYSTSMGYRLVYSLEDKESKILATGLFLGLMTYYVHGFLNNFLDTDKLSLPFWTFLAAMVTIDLYDRKKKEYQKKLPSVKN